MKWLIAEGCQLNLTNNLGDTPLHRVSAASSTKFDKEE